MPDDRVRPPAASDPRIAPEVESPAAPIPWRLHRAARSDRRVLVRSSLTVASRMISKLAVVLFLILAARLLSKHDFGIYSYVLVLASTFATLADPQVAMVAGRDVASGHASAAVSFWSAAPVVAAGGAISAVAMFVFGALDSGPGTTALVLSVAGAYVLFNRTFGLGADMLRSLGRIGAEAAIEVAGTVLLVVAASVLVATRAGITAVLLAFVGQAVFGSLACYGALFRDVGPPIRTHGRWPRMFRTGIKLSVAASATAVATRAPPLILGSAGSAIAVASYSAGLRFADTFYLLALTAGQALLPSIAALARVDPRRAARLTRRVILFAVGLGAAAAAVSFGLRGDLTGAVLGGKYSSSGTLMAVMMIGAPLMGVFWISWFALFAFGGERDVVAVALVAAAVSVAVGTAVIPSAGAIGAAWMYVGVIGLMAALTYARFERRVASSIGALAESPSGPPSAAAELPEAPFLGPDAN
ncbi:MAG: lipopolysaccharide biosynthesis protein [Solirubrobacteraceae bacterium]